MLTRGGTKGPIAQGLYINKYINIYVISLIVYCQWVNGDVSIKYTTHMNTVYGNVSMVKLFIKYTTNMNTVYGNESMVVSISTYICMTHI